MDDVPHPLLQHAVRQRIVAWVEAHPGTHLGEVVRELGLGWGNTHHHIERLTAAGLLALESESNRVHLFVPTQIPREARRLFAVLEHDCLRSVVDVVQGNPGINQRRLAAELGVTPTAARKHTRRLLAEGILEARREGKELHYLLSEEVQAHLRHEDDLLAPDVPIPAFDPWAFTATGAGAS